jgi:hypothetical protein
VAGALKIEQRRRMVGILEHVRRGLIDRRRPRAGDLVGGLARMQAQCLETGRFWRWHLGVDPELKAARRDAIP